MEYLVVLFWSSVSSVFSLVGGVFMVGSARLRQVAVRFGLPLGAGALLAAAFVGLLPEALHDMDNEKVLAYTLVGFLAFFLLERGLGWFHHHQHHHHTRVHGNRDSRSHQWLVIIGDTLHNAIDGVAVGAAFLVNPAAGVSTAIAVAAHEIPQELGDFSILLGKGMRPRNVIIVNLLSALATVVAAMLTYAFGAAYDINMAPLIAVAAGMFIYIAASDIIPDIHEQPRREANIQALMLMIGVALISTVIAMTPHEHYDTHGHDEHESTSGTHNHAEGEHHEHSEDEHHDHEHDH